MSNLPESYGLSDLELNIMEEAALAGRADEIDEVEQEKAGAFAGYGGATANRQAFVEKLRILYPDRELPEIGEGETALEYVNRTTGYFTREKEQPK